MPNDPNGYSLEEFRKERERMLDEWDGPDVSGCDGCDDPTCGFTICKEQRDKTWLEVLAEERQNRRIIDPD